MSVVAATGAGDPLPSLDRHLVLAMDRNQLWSSGQDEAVSVNQRALIDKGQLAASASTSHKRRSPCARAP